MEKYTLPNDIKAFGFQVTTFPDGIGEAFAGLVNMLPGGDNRPFYGISECTPSGIVYNAAALETHEGEAEQYHCEKYLIPKGDYLTVKVTGWQEKTNFIKIVFEELFTNELSDRNSPCIEIYNNDEEMICMVKADPTKQIISNVKNVACELLHVLSLFDAQQINIIPFERSWSAAQLADHVLKSNTSIEESLRVAGTPASRKPDERVEELKTVFLDFPKTMQAGDFLLPSQGLYNKEALTGQVRKSFDRVVVLSRTSALAECIDHPALGSITKLEMLHFVVYHTQRHLHQLKNIAQKVMDYKEI